MTNFDRPTFRLPSLLVALAVLLTGLGTSDAFAQDRQGDLPRASPNATVSQTIGVTDVTVTYGRPSVNGRTVYGDLVPYDEVWRTGANEATTITFSTDVMLEGTEVATGTYALFTTPGSDTWKIHLNSEANQWGAYNRDASKNVATVEVQAETADAQEQLAIRFDDVTDSSAKMVIHWSDVRVPVTIGVNTNDIIKSKAETAIDNGESPYMYARYAVANDVMQADALSWAKAAADMQSDKYMPKYVLALLYAANDQTDDAIQAGEEALAMMESMDEEPRQAESLRKTLDEWKSSM